MNRLLILWAVWLLGGAAPTPGADGQRPNYVFILTDDQRFDALGAAGNDQIYTPNLNRLASRGVRFENHFVTTSICAVSRASILSGQYFRRHQIGDFSTPFTPEQWSRTYPSILRQAGYRTGFIGKFGVGNARHIASMAEAFDYWRGLPGQAGEWFIDPKEPQGKHATARFGDQALEFLEGCSKTESFCLSISFNAPHARDGKPREFQPDARDESLHADTVIRSPSLANETEFARLPEFVKKSEARRRWERRFATPEMAQRTLKDYYRLVAGVDRELGRILEQLEKQGLAENTVVIFTSDNGFALGDRGLAGKWFMYEESIRVPLVIYDPRLPEAARGRVVSKLTLNIDFAPTMLERAGLQAPEQMQGRSLLPLLRGETTPDWRTAFFYEHHFGPHILPPVEGVRTERWAYLRWMPPNPELEELYDLNADPLEQKNLAGNEAFAEQLEELRADWKRARTELE